MLNEITFTKIARANSAEFKTRQLPIKHVESVIRVRYTYIEMHTTQS